MSSREGNLHIPKEAFSLSSLLPILGMMSALVIGGAIGVLEPKFWAFIVVALIMLVLLILRQDELAAAFVIAVHLGVDWYVGVAVVSVAMVFIMLIVFFLAQSSQYPWVIPRPLWLWFLFLILTVLPAIKGALTIRDALLYYPNVIVGALLMFWLGTLVARSIDHVRRLFQFLTGFAALIALHSIIQAITGRFLFALPRVADYVASQSNYELGVNSQIYRLGSFFTQPNFAGTFFAMMVLLVFGLLVESTSLLEKVLYFATILLLLFALLLTYSASAWLAVAVGIVIFMLLAGQIRYLLQTCLLVIGAIIVLRVGFPSQVNTLLKHAFNPAELMLRNAVWQTALRVIQAFPLTGIGLGHQAYLVAEDPYRVIAQYKPLDHPHNSYLEFAAMAGIPVLCVFLVLLSFVLWQALRNWIQADVRARSLLGAGIVVAIALSINSWSNQGWTLPPLLALGWLILGAISSPLLANRQNQQKTQESNENSPRVSWSPVTGSRQNQQKTQESNENGMTQHA